MRKNGFRRPFHKLQIISWIYVTFMIAACSCLALPLYSPSAKIIIGMLFTCIIVMLILLGVICTYIDPTDPALAEASRAIILSKAIDYKKYPKICKICKKHVNLDTKHCRECERCVLHFDHHCKWLNNCIGLKNYRFYIYLLATFECFNLFISISGGVVLSGVINETDYYDRLTSNVKLNNTGRGIYIALLVLMESLAGLVFIVNGQLIVFHSYLACKRQTTYEFILNRRRRENKYKVSTVKIINEREAIEEVPLEEVFEPYLENPQYDQREVDPPNSNSMVVPENYMLPPVSESENSVIKEQEGNKSMS